MINQTYSAIINIALVLGRNTGAKTNLFTEAKIEMSPSFLFLFKITWS